MQAIQTKYLGPTNCKGGRVKAICQAKSRIYSWDHALNADENHKQAAQSLAKELGWDYGTWHGGQLPDASSVWVCEAKYNSESFSI
jgi:hypothetical protein